MILQIFQFFSYFCFFLINFMNAVFNEYSATAKLKNKINMCIRSVEILNTYLPLISYRNRQLFYYKCSHFSFNFFSQTLFTMTIYNGYYLSSSISLSITTFFHYRFLMTRSIERIIIIVLQCGEKHR